MRMESTCSRVLKSAFAAIALVPILLLVGCDSGPPPYRGKVISGASSLVMNADNADARLSSKGIQGAKIELRMREGANEHLVDSATSGVNGDFELKPIEAKAVAQQLHLTATKDGMLPVKGDVYAPGPDRVLLVILKPVSATPEGSSAPAIQPSTKPQTR